MTNKFKFRLDTLLVNKRLIQSRHKAKAVIMAGEVFVDNIRHDKPGTYFSKNVDIQVKSNRVRYVGRGGLKLEAALTKNSVNCQGMVCLDVGASTGGFTDCLLQNGASKVFAVDVGYGQLAWKIRQNPRVIVIERTNIRYVSNKLITNHIDLATIDVSFISLRSVVPPILPILNKSALIIALIKPQFEVGRKRVGKGGVVKSSLLHKEVIVKLKDFFQGIGLTCGSVIQSPLLGSKGNKEFLILLEAQK